MKGEKMEITINQMQIDCITEHLIRYMFVDQLESMGHNADYDSTCMYCLHHEECLQYSKTEKRGRPSALLDPIFKRSATYKGERTLH